MKTNIYHMENGSCSIKNNLAASKLIISDIGDFPIETKDYCIKNGLSLLRVVIVVIDIQKQERRVYVDEIDAATIVEF